MASKPKQKCKYGATCYRKNRDHLDNFQHQKDAQSGDDEKNGTNSNSEVDEEKNDTAKCSFENNKENRVDLSKTLDLPLDHDADFEKFEKIDLTQVKDLKSLVDEYNHQMKMPDDFYEFLDFCKSIDPNDPKNAFKAAGIELAGIYDLLCLGLKVDYRFHSRYFYDVPEFQTVLTVKTSPNMMHFGYFRDDPNELPAFVGMNEAKLDCKIHCKGDNIFSAVNWYLDELMSGRSHKSNSNSMNMDEVKEVKKKLADWCDEHHKTDKTFSLQLKTPKIKSREKKVNCKTFHGAGICVPVDSRGFGYRDVPETEDKQKKIFEGFCSEAESDRAKKEKSLEKIQEIITLIQFANDESDYGMGIEFGVNMFGFGDLKLHKFMKSTIIVSYKLLGRDLYAEILIEHLKNRKLKL